LLHRINFKFRVVRPLQAELSVLIITSFIIFSKQVIHVIANVVSEIVVQQIFTVYSDGER